MHSFPPFSSIRLFITSLIDLSFTTSINVIFGLPTFFYSFNLNQLLYFTRALIAFLKT